MNTKTVTLTTQEIRAILEALGVAHANWSSEYQYGHLNESEESFYKAWETLSDKLTENAKVAS